MSEELSPQANTSRAKEILLAAAPEAAEKLVENMRFAKPEVSRLASLDILAVSGIEPKRASAESASKLIGTAIIAALAGAAKVMGVRGVGEKELREAVPALSSEPDVLLPPELQDQEALS